MGEELDIATKGSNIDAGSDNEDVLSGLNLHQARLQEVQNGEDKDLMGFFQSDSDSDSEFEGFHSIWVEQRFDTQFARRFIGESGASEQQSEEAQPIHYFDMICGDEVWSHLVRETNTYAQQESARNPPPPNAPKWTHRYTYIEGFLWSSV